jgi:hypothetical protein
MGLKMDMHGSHKITKNPQAIVGERFATTYECDECGASGYETVAGKQKDAELDEPCPYGDRRSYLEYNIKVTKIRLTLLTDELAALSAKI